MRFELRADLDAHSGRIFNSTSFSPAARAAPSNEHRTFFQSSPDGWLPWEPVGFAMRLLRPPHIGIFFSEPARALTLHKVPIEELLLRAAPKRQEGSEDTLLIGAWLLLIGAWLRGREQLNGAAVRVDSKSALSQVWNFEIFTNAQEPVRLAMRLLRPPAHIGIFRSRWMWAHAVGRSRHGARKSDGRRFGMLLESSVFRLRTVVAHRSVRKNNQVGK
jgi:hypothetical protein